MVCGIPTSFSCGVRGPLSASRPGHRTEFFVSPTATKAPVAPEVLSALSRLRNDKARRAFLRKHKLLSPDVIVELNAATSQELRVNTENALSLAEGAVAAARCI